MQRAFVRFLTGARAHIVVEAGERTARVLLARRVGEAVRLERVLTADLRADALLSPAEMAARLRALLAELPPAAATLVLPAGRTHSQLMDLRDGDSRAVEELARAVGGRQFEAVPSVFDARPLRPTARHPRPVWVSIAREADVEIQLLRCGIPAGRVAGVVGADAALAAAFSTLPERPATAVLIELAAGSGLLVVVEESQPVFAADLDWGSDYPTAALALDLGCTAAAAEAILVRDGAEAAGPAAPRLVSTLQRFFQRVELLLRDYAREAGRPEAELLAAPRWLGGAELGRSRVRELLAHAAGGAELRAWPELATVYNEPFSLSSGAVAYGAAVAALGLAQPPPNLAPPTARAARRGELWVGALHAAGIGAAAAALLLGAWTLHGRGRALEARAEEAEALRAARAAVPPLQAERDRRDAAYLTALPSLYFQKRSHDFVVAVRSLRERRGSGDFWFALIADAETYQAGSLPQGTPVAAPETQLLPAFLARQTGLVVELSFRPGGGDPLTQVGELITELRASGQFTSVDILPARARQATLADRSVFAAEGGDFALQLDVPAFDGAIPPRFAPAGGGGLFQSNPR